MKILVTGGMGFVGHGIASTLVSQGHEVHVIGRTQNPPKSKLISGLYYHSHDLTRGMADAGWFKEFTTVFHVAAKAGIGGKYEEYRLANLVATEKLLQACQQQEVERFIYTSTPSVTFSIDPIRGGNENLPYSKEKFSPYASTKALAEQAVLSTDQPNRMRTLALRPHLIWGAGDPHLLPRVIGSHRQGKLKRIGKGENRVDLTHVDNVVHAHTCAFRAMLDNPLLGGKAYFIGQNEPVNLWDWLNDIFKILELPHLEKTVSYKNAYRIGWLMEKIWGILPLTSDPPMTRFVASQLAHDHWFSGEAAEQDLQYNPPLNMAEAMEKTIPWLKTL